MKLRQQFAVLTAVVALLIAISCGVGYYMASSMLTGSEEIASSSNALAQMAVELQNSTNKFKL